MQRNFLSILVLVTRLKQACLDPALLPEDITDVMNNLKDHVRKRKKKGKPLSATEIQALFNCLNGIAKKATEEVYECVICYEPQDTKDIRVIRNCKHSFCVSCLEKYIRMEQAKGNMQAMYVVFVCVHFYDNVCLFLHLFLTLTHTQSTQVPTLQSSVQSTRCHWCKQIDQGKEETRKEEEQET